MVFYAFCKFQANQDIYRWLIAAPDADTIDEWWRAVSAKGDIKRLAPDFYTIHSNDPRPAAPEFAQRLMVTLLNNSDGRILSNFTQQERTNHVSGGTFYVRSKSNPNLFWSEGSNGLIYASDRCRLRLRFRIENGDDQGKVMIGSDPIGISVARNSKLHVGVNDAGQLQVGRHGDRFFFHDLKKDFLADGPVDNAVVVKSDGDGEEWELVA